MQPDEALRQLTEALPGLAAGTAIAASRLSVSTLEDPERPILVDLDEAGASRVAAPGAGKEAQGAAYDCLHSLLLAESPLYAQWYFASVAQRLLAAAAQRGDEDEDDSGDGKQYCGNSKDDGEDGNEGCGGCSAGKSSEARDV